MSDLRLFAVLFDQIPGYIQTQIAVGGNDYVSDHRPGYYQDSNGSWQKDRRKSSDRRVPGTSDGSWPHHDRRLQLRRKTDTTFVERDAHEQIQDALEDFAAHHDAHGHPIDD